MEKAKQQFVSTKPCLRRVVPLKHTHWEQRKNAEPCDEQHVDRQMSLDPFVGSCSCSQLISPPSGGSITAPMQQATIVFHTQVERRNATKRGESQGMLCEGGCFAQVLLSFFAPWPWLASSGCCCCCFSSYEMRSLFLFHLSALFGTREVKMLGIMKCKFFFRQLLWKQMGASGRQGIRCGKKVSRLPRGRFRGELCQSSGKGQTWGS